MHRVVPEIACELEPLIVALHGLGVVPHSSQYDASAFGNYLVDFSGDGRRFRVVKDRSQYFIDADREELEDAGLWRAFGNREDFFGAVLSWLKGESEK